MALVLDRLDSDKELPGAADASQDTYFVAEGTDFLTSSAYKVFETLIDFENEYLQHSSQTVQIVRPRIISADARSQVLWDA